MRLFLLVALALPMSDEGTRSWIGAAPTPAKAQEVIQRYQVLAASNRACGRAFFKQLHSFENSHRYIVGADVVEGCACCNHLLAHDWLARDDENSSHYCTCGPGVE